MFLGTCFGTASREQDSEGVREVAYQAMAGKAFLVLDTMIWVYKTRLLNTGLGAAVLYSLHQTGPVLALPEVIEEEIRKHTIKNAKEAVEAIQKKYRLIEQLMGERDDYRVPSDAEISKRVQIRLEELAGLVHPTNFTLGHARAALGRVIEESPPNAYGDQQFKDSAIWEAVLELGKEGNVDFVTEDKAFFQEKNPSQGLAENLKRDCQQVSGTIKVHYGLDEYLRSIKAEQAPLNHQEIAASIDRQIRPHLMVKAVDKGYQLGNLSEFAISAYLTEKPNIIAVEFALYYNTFGVRLPGSQEEVEAKEVFEGDCIYGLAEKSALEIEPENIYLVDSSGKRVPAFGEVFVRASSAMGRRTVTYTLREPIED
jgi:hypothetical protein